jgi:hypothetical protein
LQKYYLPADLSNANLSVGFDQFIQRDAELKEHIDTLLDALTHLRSKNTDSASIKANIVCISATICAQLSEILKGVALAM